jgi:cell pole-organizing protein PopZ
MEDIIRSIRRIIDEEAGLDGARTGADRLSPFDPATTAPHPVAVAPAIWTEGLAASAPAEDDMGGPIRRIIDGEAGPGDVMPTPDHVLQLDPSMMVPEPGAAAPAARTEGLVAPEAANEAAQAVGSLVRTLAADRAVQVHSGGPTIEDLVREEIRPLLKQWLDANLPHLVERTVRAEIERVVSRAVP